MKARLAILTLGVSLLMAGPVLAQPKMTIYDTLKAAGNFKTLVTLIDKANVNEVKQMPGPFTMFAPNDAAFAKLPPKKLKRIMTIPAITTNVVYFDIIPGKYTVEKLPQLKECKTLCPTASAQPLHFTKVGPDKYLVNDANIVKANIMCTNGVIQEIDKVLIPKMAPPNVP